MATAKPGRGSDQFPLRLPDGMRERIKEASDQNGRSMNAEIISTLEKAFPKRTEDFGAMFLRLFNELMEIADQGEEAKLKARIINANLSLARAGHGKIELYVIPGPPLGVGSRNVDTEKQLRRIEEAVRKNS
jgi:hypothetical protein